MDPRYEWFTGEPDALKGASPVRRGAVGNLLTVDSARRETPRGSARRWLPTLLAKREEPMPDAAWGALPERLAMYVPLGQVLDRPSAAELEAALDDYETRSGIRLPASYREFLHRFGPGELSGYFRISSPIPPQLRGRVADAFDIDALREMLDDPEGYWATEIAPTLTRRLVLFAETIGGDWLLWDVGDVRDPARSEYGVYGFARGDRRAAGCWWRRASRSSSRVSAWTTASQPHEMRGNRSGSSSLAGRGGKPAANKVLL